MGGLASISSLCFTTTTITRSSAKSINVSFSATRRPSISPCIMFCGRDPIWNLGGHLLYSFGPSSSFYQRSLFDLFIPGHLVYPKCLQPRIKASLYHRFCITVKVVSCVFYLIYNKINKKCCFNIHWIDPVYCIFIESTY